MDEVNITFEINTFRSRTVRHVSHVLPAMILFVAKKGHYPPAQPFKLEVDFQNG